MDASTDAGPERPVDPSVDPSGKRSLGRSVDGVALVMPALLRFAWRTYADAVVGGLASSGIDDLPRHGAFVLGGMANHGAAAADMVAGLGVSKQRASQLIDTLVLRGYLDREVNADDRRRLTIRLTERGRAAAAEIRTAVQTVDARLALELSVDEVAALRAGLAAVARLGAGERPAR